MELEKLLDEMREAIIRYRPEYGAMPFTVHFSDGKIVYLDVGVTIKKKIT